MNVRIIPFYYLGLLPGTRLCERMEPYLQKRSVFWIFVVSAIDSWDKPSIQWMLWCSFMQLDWTLNSILLQILTSAVFSIKTNPDCAVLLRRFSVLFPKVYRVYSPSLWTSAPFSVLE